MNRKYPKKSDLQKEITRLLRVNAAYAHWKKKWYAKKNEMIVEMSRLKNRTEWLQTKLERMENESRNKS